MNHNTDGGWKMWLPMILCCVTMIGALLLLGGWLR
jgi:hypothetical protein